MVHITEVIQGPLQYFETYRLYRNVLLMSMVGD